MWDYFVPLQGKGVIEVTRKARDESGGQGQGETVGKERGQGVDGDSDVMIEEYPMEPHSFLAMPPTAIHRVRNQSEADEFVFLIAQTPAGRYDFIAAR